ncbi:DUF2806 domain-containing protein [Herbaspirillum sp. SJZ107]|uniref:DUF2806 domain-containing protein n=1 Tax=Herbaspirillum sp. SJZ107 TaxID=2572881 RepID=UPI0016396A11|nr:DUF2806 domain-containing protein [Herbaspirillum sp. SJZ107]
MSEQNTDDEQGSDGNEDSGRLLSTATDLTEMVVTGVPAPIRRSLIKVLGRLTTAAVEYPVTLLENAIKERKAESNARVRLIDASKTQIAKQMKVDPAYVQAAASKFAERIVRERVNVDQIAALTVEELTKLQPPHQVPDNSPEDRSDVDEDWLNVFEGEAAQVSSEHAQKVFAKILAGEINRPSSFSKKTLKLISQLDNSAAQLFSLACSMSVSLQIPGHIIDARVLGLGRIGQNSLATYGMPYGAVVILQEYGLIVSDLAGYSDYQLSQVVDGTVSLPLTHQNEHWALVKQQGQARTEMRLEGMQFTASGRELLSIVELQPVPKYTEAMAAFLRNQFQVELTKIAKA